MRPRPWREGGAASMAERLRVIYPGLRIVIRDRYNDG